MRAFFAAVQFLTRLPFPATFTASETDLRNGIFFFPIVGLFIGGVAAFLDHVVGLALPPLPASVALVVLLLAVSGAFHMDGLADTADGFLSSRPKERILEIMRDSHIGPMGVLAMVLVVALKISALASIDGELRWSTILLMPLAGRCALVIHMAILPYAREKGLASVFVKHKSAFQIVVALVFLSASAWFLLGMLGLAMALASLFWIFAFSLYCRKKIGGFTGDTLGACCEISETIPALATAAWIHMKW